MCCVSFFFYGMFRLRAHHLSNPVKVLFHPMVRSSPFAVPSRNRVASLSSGTAGEQDIHIDIHCGKILAGHWMALNHTNSTFNSWPVLKSYRYMRFIWEQKGRDRTTGVWQRHTHLLYLSHSFDISRFIYINSITNIWWFAICHLPPPSVEVSSLWLDYLCLHALSWPEMNPTNFHHILQPAIKQDTKMRWAHRCSPHYLLSGLKEKTLPLVWAPLVWFEQDFYSWSPPSVFVLLRSLLCVSRAAVRPEVGLTCPLCQCACVCGGGCILL